MTPGEILIEASRRGLRLEPVGEKLAVFPKGKCPPDFANVLRQHKPELLSWLEGQAAGLGPTKRDLKATKTPPDGERADGWTVGRYPIGAFADVLATFPPVNRPVPRIRPAKGGTEREWLHIARQVLAGEFDGDRTAVESLTIGLRSIRHPLCQQALARLQTHRPKSAP